MSRAVCKVKSKYLALAWVVTMLAVFLFFHAKAASDAEYEIAGTLYLAFLSAPSGLFLIAAWGLLGPVLQGPGLLTAGGLSILVFLSFVLVGYVQWFVVIPRLVRGLRQRTG